MNFHGKFTSKYVINGHTINESSNFQDLGIIFTNTLTWREHYEMISAKAYKSLGLLHRVFKNSHSPRVTKSLYISLVRAKLLYCSLVRKPYLLKEIDLLEGVQRRADYSSDYRTRLINIGILPLMYVYKIADIFFVCPQQTIV